MEIPLNPDQEARLAELAVRNGRKPDDLVWEAVDRCLEDEARFAEAVRLGLAAAENGDLVASDEVWAGVEPGFEILIVLRLSSHFRIFFLTNPDCCDRRSAYCNLDRCLPAVACPKQGDRGVYP